MLVALCLDRLRQVLLHVGRLAPERIRFFVQSLGNLSRQILDLLPLRQLPVCIFDRLQIRAVRAVSPTVNPRGLQRRSRIDPDLPPGELPTRFFERTHGKQQNSGCVEQVDIAARAEDRQQQLKLPFFGMQPHGSETILTQNPDPAKARAPQVSAQVLGERRRRLRRLGRLFDYREAREFRRTGKQHVALAGLCRRPAGTAEAEDEIDVVHLRYAFQPRAREPGIQRSGSTAKLGQAEHRILPLWSAAACRRLR